MSQNKRRRSADTRMSVIHCGEFADVYKLVSPGGFLAPMNVHRDFSVATITIPNWLNFKNLLDASLKNTSRVSSEALLLCIKHVSSKYVRAPGTTESSALVLHRVDISTIERQCKSGASFVQQASLNALRLLSGVGLRVELKLLLCSKGSGDEQKAYSTIPLLAREDASVSVDFFVRLSEPHPGAQPLPCSKEAFIHSFGHEILKEPRASFSGNLDLAHVVWVPVIDNQFFVINPKNPSRHSVRVIRYAIDGPSAHSNNPQVEILSDSILHDQESARAGWARGSIRHAEAVSANGDLVLWHRVTHCEIDAQGVPGCPTTVFTISRFRDVVPFSIRLTPVATVKRYADVLTASAVPGFRGVPVYAHPRPCADVIDYVLPGQIRRATAAVVVVPTDGKDYAELYVQWEGGTRVDLRVSSPQPSHSRTARETDPDVAPVAIETPATQSTEAGVGLIHIRGWSPLVGYQSIHFGAPDSSKNSYPIPFFSHVSLQNARAFFDSPGGQQYFKTADPKNAVLERHFPSLEPLTKSADNKRECLMPSEIRPAVSVHYNDETVGPFFVEWATLSHVAQSELTGAGSDRIEHDNATLEPPASLSELHIPAKYPSVLAFPSSLLKALSTSTYSCLNDGKTQFLTPVNPLLM